MKQPIPFDMHCSSCQRSYDATELPDETFQEVVGGVLITGSKNHVDLCEGHESSISFASLKEARDMYRAFGRAIKHVTSLNKSLK